MRFYKYLYRGLLFLLLITFSSNIFSQKPPVKWGKVSPDEWKMKVCDFDTSASAIVLCDYGQINFEYGKPITVTIHTRIKILKKRGLDQANITIPFYKRNNIENIIKIKAQTINKTGEEGAGTYKVNNQDFFEVDADETWGEMRFSMPSVQVGSIIEYQYVLRTKDAFQLKGWTLQSDIPTLHSEIRAKISEGFDVRIFFRGGRLLKKYGFESLSRWFLTKLPAIKTEPYCPNPQDYLERIEFQLAGYYKRSASYNFDRSSEYVNTMTTWDELANEVMTTEKYNQYLSGGRKISNLTNPLISDDMNEREKVINIYNYVKDEYFWDGKYSVFPGIGLNDFLDKKSGRSANINLLLVSMLQEAGIDATPFLISTLGHGRISDTYPILSQFNHVLAHIKLYGKDQLLDATDPFRPYDYLDVNDYNGLGLSIKKYSSGWVPIKQEKKGKTFINVTIEPDNEEYQYVTKYHFSGYKAIINRKLLAENNERTYAENYLETEEPDLVLDSLRIKNKKEIEKPLIVICYYRKEEVSEISPLFYLKPIITSDFNKNPFVNPVRTLPVYFNFPFEYQYSVNIKIPNNYQIEDVPEQIKLNMPDKSGSFSYLVQVTGSILQIQSKMKFDKTSYSVREYDALRELFDRYIAKNQETVVLKKQ